MEARGNNTVKDNADIKKGKEKMSKFYLKDIVAATLREMGADGLYYWECHDGSDECGCKLDDLMPCSEPSPKCEAAKRCKTTDEDEIIYGNIKWLMKPIKDEDKKEKKK